MKSASHIVRRPQVYARRRAGYRRRSFCILIAAALSTPLHAQVPIPSSTTTVNLQALSPGSTTFQAAASTVVNVTSGNGVAGDNSQNWQLTNFGSISTDSLGGFAAVQLNSASNNGALLDNYGSIAGTGGAGGSALGVLLPNGGTINNYAGGQISSTGFYGILSQAGLATISNDGAISGSSSGIRLGTGGSVTQSQTGTITSSSGAGILNDNGPLSISNAGSISGSSGAGVFARGTTTGTIVNSGSITGPIGVLLQAGGVSLTNIGTITGTGGTAVSISGSNNTLTLGTGSVLNGNAVVTSGTGNNLVLQGTGSTGSALTGFTDLTMSGTGWLISGNATTADTTNGATTVQSGTLTVTGSLTSSGSGGGVTINPGATLQIGNAGTSGRLVFGSSPGDVVNNGALVFNRADDITFSDTVIGSGTLTQNGTGTLFITSNIIDGGVTTINAGTLSIGNGVTDGSVATDIVDNGALVFDRSSTRFSNFISGSGTLQKLGTGTLILTGNNAYTGATIISAGVLQMGRGPNFGLIGTGPVEDDASLVFDRSDVVSLDNLISGGGNVAQIGSGTIELTNANTYTGGTTISAGTLQLGDGGTSGSIAGDVIDNATLAFDRSDAVTFSGVISGNGTLLQQGAGTLALDGNSGSFIGTTTVQSGSLIVGDTAGDGAALGGNVSVNAGATLGGHGTIGGNVDVAAGAFLAPGNSIGTLTISGNATLAQGSQLDYAFGAPSANFTTFGSGDSVQVGGNLQLDGAALNVTDTGSMGPGLYNLFTYGGTLTETNGGIALGVTPAGEQFQIQTLTADKQINLLDTTGLTLDFWNGNGLASATQMGGGNGTWSATATNWTTATGSVTAAMQPQPGFAIFGGAAGTVTVDNSAGTVSVTGLQFANNGYMLSGDTLTLVGTAPIVRVGNGSAAGAAYTATIGNVLAGSGDLTKTDLGTLVLTGANTYSGGTTIDGGTLEISSDGNLGAASGGLTLDGGTLEVTGTAFTSTARSLTLGGAGGSFDIADAGNTFTVAQSLGGSGGLSLTGPGTLIFTGANTYTGGTTISAGTLQLGDGSTSGSIVGDVADNASLVFDRADINTFGDVISGTGTVAQIGAGTTVLSNANNYAGGTFINGGTLSVSADNNLGAPAGAVSLNGGTLLLAASFNSTRDFLLQAAGGTIDATNSNALSGPITGTGALSKTGNGTLIINSMSNYTGLTTVAAGTLVVGDSAHPGAQLAGGGGVDVNTGAAFGGYGQAVGSVNNAGTLGVGSALTALANEPDASFTIVGGLVNTGTVTMANGVASDTLNVTGSYVSSGGQIDMDAVLNQGGAAAQSDRLVANTVELVGAPTSIMVHPTGGSGALTQGDGIPLVTVLNPSASAAGAFTLAGRVVGGPYEYLLFQGGVTDPANGQWYLRSDVEPTPPTPPGPPTPTPPTPPTPPVPIFRPEVGAYLANREASSGLLVQSLHERQGDPQYSSDGSTDADSSMGKVWVRTLAGSTRTDAADDLLDAHGDRTLLQLGGDVGNWNLFGQNDRLHVGGMAGYADTDADITAQFNPAQAHGHTDGYLAGAYATWFANNDRRLGSYVDTWIQYGWFNNVVRSTLLPSVSYDSTSWAASIEYGYGFGVGQHLVVEPEAQVVYTDYDADRITDSTGTAVRALDGSDILGRLGVRVYPQLASDYAWRPFIEVNWWHGGGTDKIAFNGIPVADSVPDNRYQANLGFQSRVHDGWLLWTRIGDEWGSGSYRRVEAQFGVKYSW